MVIISVLKIYYNVSCLFKPKIGTILSVMTFDDSGSSAGRHIGYYRCTIVPTPTIPTWTGLSDKGPHGSLPFPVPPPFWLSAVITFHQ